MTFAERWKRIEETHPESERSYENGPRYRMQRDLLVEALAAASQCIDTGEYRGAQEQSDAASVVNDIDAILATLKPSTDGAEVSRIVKSTAPHDDTEHDEANCPSCQEDLAAMNTDTPVSDTTVSDERLQGAQMDADERKRCGIDIDAQKLKAALRELSNAFVMGLQGSYGMRIPAEPYRDGDLVCGAAFRLIEQLERELLARREADAAGKWHCNWPGCSSRIPHGHAGLPPGAAT